MRQEVLHELVVRVQDERLAFLLAEIHILHAVLLHHLLHPAGLLRQQQHRAHILIAELFDLDCDIVALQHLLEEAGKSGDTAYIVANHMAMMTVYDRLLDAIREKAPSGNDNNVDETAGSDDDDEVLEFDAVGDEEGGVV